MDLALHLGRTVHELQESMTAVELGLWIKYARKKMLPWRRMEIYLAQVSRTVATAMGGAGKTKLTDFLLDQGGEEDDGEESSAEAFFQFNPRNVPPPVVAG